MKFKVGDHVRLSDEGLRYVRTFPRFDRAYGIALTSRTGVVQFVDPRNGFILVRWPGCVATFLAFYLVPAYPR